MAPVIAALRARLPDARHALVHTGQHYDALMSDVFLDELAVPAPDHTLRVGSGSHAEQTALVLERLGPVLSEADPDLVLVPGDVNSSVAAALAAAEAGIAVAHVESGLRSFDRSMPEETNRIVVDELSTLLFLHSEEGAENLRCPTDALRRSFVEDPYYEYVIDEARCIGCAKCVNGCTTFGNGSLHLQIRHDRCKNCNECYIARVCPVDAFVRVPADNPYLIKKAL